MGADARRKDARKRKFRRTQHFSPVAAPQTSSDAGDAARTPKCAKPMSPTDGATSANEAEREPDNARTTDATGDEGTDRGEGRPQETTHTQASRFVCFVGNLPFTTTQISLTQHFAKIKPSAIRHRTSKDTGKSKGFAFVEFGCYDRMKTCLQLYHHSAFNDGLSPARLINVELTAGGGGAKSKERRSKLQLKNERLNEQRKRRASNEAKTASQPRASSSQRSTNDTTIHPSRRSMVSSG